MATKTTTSKTNRSAKAAAPAARAPARGNAKAPTAMYRSKLALGNVADGAKNIKQALRAVERLAKQLAKLDAAGVKLEQPVARNVAMLVTSDAKAARRFGMDEKRGGAKKTSAQKAGSKNAGA